MSSPEIVHDPDRSRFEIRLDGDVIGKSYYQSEPGRRVFTHTEVDPEYQGQGLASQLIKVALDDTRDAELRLVPQCPAVAAYIAKHPEYVDIVDGDVAPS
jgi:predicted GNAT family acetyltransferase